MAVPAFVSDTPFAVQSSHDPTALFVVSLVSLLANVAVAVYQAYVIVSRRRNPLRDELYVVKSIVKSYDKRLRRPPEKPED